MKFIRESAHSLVSAVLELVVGVLLLLNPAGFTTGIVIGLGVLLTAAGLIAAVQYFMAKPEEASKQQGLTKGLILGIVGLFCALFADAFVALFPLLTMLYGLLLLILSAAKIQIAVDMLRLKRTGWRFAAVSALLSVIVAVFVLVFPFDVTALVWALIAVSLIAEAALDMLAVFLHKKAS